MTTKVEKKNQNDKEFSELEVAQTIIAHQAQIWVASFSVDGNFLATGGQDGIVKIWKILDEIE